MDEQERADKCPICEEPHGIGRAEDCPTDLCNQCALNRFYLDDDREVRFRKEVEVRISKLKELFKDDYDDTLHRKMVEQMVRCEIAIDRYDQLIQNDNEAPQTAELLKSERQQWNKLADKLNMTIAKLRGDTKKVEHDFTNDFREYLKRIMIDGDGNGQGQEQEESEE